MGPLIIRNGARCNWSTSRPCYPLNWGLGRFQSRSLCLREEKNHFSLLRTELGLHKLTNDKKTQSAFLFTNIARLNQSLAQNLPFQRWYICLFSYYRIPREVLSTKSVPKNTSRTCNISVTTGAHGVRNPSARHVSSVPRPWSRPEGLWGGGREALFPGTTELSPRTDDWSADSGPSSPIKFRSTNCYLFSLWKYTDISSSFIHLFAAG